MMNKLLYKQMKGEQGEGVQYIKYPHPDNMDESLVLELTREGIMTIITVAGPIVLIALAVGLIVSIFQTVTSIQEQTLAFVPKILAVFISILILGPWLLNRLVELMVNAFKSFQSFL